MAWLARSALRSRVGVAGEPRRPWRQLDRPMLGASRVGYPTTAVAAWAHAGRLATRAPSQDSSAGGGPQPASGAVRIDRLDAARSIIFRAEYAIGSRASQAASRPRAMWTRTSTSCYRRHAVNAIPRSGGEHATDRDRLRVHRQDDADRRALCLGRGARHPLPSRRPLLDPRPVLPGRGGAGGDAGDASHDQGAVSALPDLLPRRQRHPASRGLPARRLSHRGGDLRPALLLSRQRLPGLITAASSRRCRPTRSCCC